MHHRRPTVLLVHDETETRIQFANWLAAGGYQCVTASDSVAALGCLGRTSPDVAVIDIGHQGRDGLWLAQRLRERTTPTGVVLLSRRGSQERAAAMRMGVSDYLIKPCHPEELLAAVGRAAGWRDDEEARAIDARTEVMATVAGRHAAFKHLIQGSSTPEAVNDALLRSFRNGEPALFGHGRRVARVAATIAKALHLSAEAIADIAGAALLHDVGKLSLPEAVLLGYQPVSDSEMEALLDHQSRTLDLLRGEPLFPRVVALLESVHESWDGSGYPAGMAGRAIPFGARIIAVADVFDACCTHDERQTRDSVQSVLMREAGTRLDPDLVCVCLHVMDEEPCL